MEIIPVIIILIVGIFLLTFFTVSQQTVVIIERFGKYNRMCNPGLHFKIPLIERKAGALNMRIRQLDVPVETKTAQTKPAEVFQPQEIIYIEMPLSQDKDEVFSLKSFVDKTPESSTYISEPNRILYNSGGSTNRLDVAQTSFFNLAEDLGSSDPTRVSFSVRPRTRGTLFRNFGITGADASVNIALPNKGRSLFGGDT